MRQIAEPVSGSPFVGDRFSRLRADQPGVNAAGNGYIGCAFYNRTSIAEKRYIIFR